MAKKVIVAMSGGVDSSVAAALLKKDGYEVIGVFMKFWTPRIYADKADLYGYGNRCCTPESEKRARTVAKILKIPFYVFNFEKEFKKRIVDYFLDGYKKGITPNPCVVCNKEIKFGLLMEKALKLDADYIATGHYCRLRRIDAAGPIKLLKGKDKKKDQSYFLWQLNQKQLKHILFSVGNYTKDQVRVLAKKFKLPVADIPESQEICFIQTTINDFLKRYIKPKPGKIVDKLGNVLGEHQGLWFYTIGQRKGLRIAAGKPFYVLDKNTKKNLLVVTQNEKDLLKKELIAKNINWVSGIAPKFPLKIKAKIRYKQSAAGATILKYQTGRSAPCNSFGIKQTSRRSAPPCNRSAIKKKGKVRLIFSKSQRAITPGQSVVFYKNQEVIGGGIIE